MAKKAQQRISEEAVKRATGRTWEEWFRILDKEGAKKMEHKEIARLLYTKHKVSGWWSQGVTVEYERSRKKRALGKTADAGFEIGVTKTIPVAPDKIWKTSPKGLKLWLGTAPNLKLKPGEIYKTKEGTTGEIRTIKPGERIRLTWHPKFLKRPSTLQITVTPRLSMRGTCVGFHQEKLSNAKDRAHMREHWQKTLDKIQKRISTPVKYLRR